MRMSTNSKPSRFWINWLLAVVIGGVMVGRGNSLFYVVQVLLSAGSRVAWNLIALSVGTWFLSDTAYSLVSGYWQNALLNTVFFILFALPLWATSGQVHHDA